jgi:hypothetical protein
MPVGLVTLISVKKSPILPCFAQDSARAEILPFSRLTRDADKNTACSPAIFICLKI